MEYADGGDLFSLIKNHQKNSTLIDEDIVWKIFIQCIRGLKYLHENKIMHRDLKVKNFSRSPLSSVLIFSWQRITKQSWVTWMCLKWWSERCRRLKQARLITHHLKYGKTLPTMSEATSGALAAFSMRWFRSNLPLGHRTWKAFRRRCSEEFTQKST